MIVAEPGHLFHLLCYDPTGREPAKLDQRLDFFKKIGEKFSGNVGGPSWGTNSQEVLRVLIHRAIYLDHQQPCSETKFIISLFRQAFYQFEARATRVKGKEIEFWEFIKTLPPDNAGIEDLPHCNICGHILPHTHDEIESPKP